jgi:hypothetical protein
MINRVIGSLLGSLTPMQRKVLMAALSSDPARKK